MSLNIVLLAGDVGYSRFLLEARNKALLELDGALLLDYTLAAIRQTSEFAAVTVVGPPDVLAKVPDRLGQMNVLRLEQRATVGSNLRLALETAEKPFDPFVAVTCDAPLTTSSELDAFARGFRLSLADAMVAVSRVTSAVPDEMIRVYRQSMVPLRDGPYVMGNLFGFGRSSLRALTEIDEVFSFRKQTRWSTKIRTFGRLAALGVRGPSLKTWVRIAIAKALWTSRPSSDKPFRTSVTLEQVESCLNSLGGLRTQFLRTEPTGACWDVDTPEQLATVRRILAQRHHATVLADRGRKRA